MKRLFVLFVWLCIAICTATAQLTGVVIDANDGGPIPYASVMYKGNHVGVSCNGSGQFSISQHMGWRLTFSAVGYQSQVVNVGPATPTMLTIRLKSESRRLQEVTVQSKRKTRYRRKDNPAVDFMRKVIAAKKQSDIHQQDYFKYNNYQKISISLNDLRPDDLKSGLFKRFPWLTGHVEESQYNGKLVLPLTINETFSECYYRKTPKRELTRVIGKRSTGLNDLFTTGDIITLLAQATFSDIDIYDDNILLMRHKFCSPIGRDAIQFYRYYLTDTLFIGDDRCIQLDFVANNQQDFGFRGRLYVLDDSSYQVKRCELTIPRSGDVNWIESMQCMQEYTKQPDGKWLLTVDDMIVELMVTNFMAKGLVTRTTRYRDFDFSPLPDKVFRGKGETETVPMAAHRDSTFWANHREVELSNSEEAMERFLDRIRRGNGYNYTILLLKALIESYIETGTDKNPSKIDIGPINTFISRNFYDGLRLRVGGQTTANLNPHWFGKGYYAYGTRHNEHYYSAALTYSLRPCEHLPQEFPRRAITLSAMHDVALPSDKFLTTDKDNLFASLKIHEVDKMFMYNNQRLSIDYETNQHLRYSLSLKTEEIRPIGNISLTPLSMSTTAPVVPEGAGLPSIRYTELTAGLRLSPKEKFFNTKAQRHTLTHDAWYISLQHTIGFNHLLGGQYNYNFTELAFYRRNWLPMSWGHIDVRLKAGIQWNQVPYPLLIMPQANLSYIYNESMFSMLNNMEFLNDRYVSLMACWELDGKILNRIPLLRKLKWREILEIKGLWGGLSEKNNPWASQNEGSLVLMHFPEGSSIMDGRKPYLEFSIGIQNIFNLLQVQYVRRLNYLDQPMAPKHSVRFLIIPQF